VTVITTAFEVAGKARAAALGMPDHPRVVIDHPLTSRTSEEIRTMAARAVDLVAAGLMDRP
jgi:hypothetical protein